MDIQSVLDVYSCIMYIVSFISKAERKHGDLLRNAQKEAKEGHLEPVQQLRKLGNVYLNSRELSVMEAIYRVTGMHLNQSSRQVVFIPADRHAARLSKPLKLLSEEDDNIWMTSIIDRYVARPTTPDFENMCLAVFVRDYRVYDRTTHDTDDIQDMTDHETSGTLTPLQNNMGTISKRTKPAVIRYMKVNKDKQSEDYYHNLFKLFMSHRSTDLKPLNADTYEQTFQQLSTSIIPIMSQFEKITEDLDDAWTSLQEQGFPEDAWVDIAPNQEPLRLDDDEELQNVLQYFRENAEEILVEDILDFTPNQKNACC